MDFEIKINEKLSLLLRKPEDSDALYRLVDSNREHLRPWFPWVDTTITSEDTKKFIIDCQEKFESKKAADFGIKYEGEWIGSMGFHTIDIANEWAEIGYWIAKGYEGKGLMALCVQAMINYGFKDCNLHRIQIKSDSRNTRSEAIPKKLGFTLEGRTRESRKNEEGFSDGLTFGLLRKDWQS